jgi:hypothetical protein
MFDEHPSRVRISGKMPSIPCCFINPIAVSSDNGGSLRFALLARM